MAILAYLVAIVSVAVNIYFSVTPKWKRLFWSLFPLPLFLRKLVGLREDGEKSPYEKGLETQEFNNEMKTMLSSIYKYFIAFNNEGAEVDYRTLHILIRNVFVHSSPELKKRLKLPETIPAFEGGSGTPARVVQNTTNARIPDPPAIIPPTPAIIPHTPPVNPPTPQVPAPVPPTPPTGSAGGGSAGSSNLSGVSQGSNNAPPGSMRHRDSMNAEILRRAQESARRRESLREESSAGGK